MVHLSNDRIIFKLWICCNIFFKLILICFKVLHPLSWFMIFLLTLLLSLEHLYHSKSCTNSKFVKDQLCHVQSRMVHESKSLSISIIWKKNPTTQFYKCTISRAEDYYFGLMNMGEVLMVMVIFTHEWILLF